MSSVPVTRDINKDKDRMNLKFKIEEGCISG